VLALAPRLFGERARLGDGLWGAVAIAGAAAVVLGGKATGGSDAFGNMLAAGALVAWTWYFVASKRAREELGSFEYLAGLSVVALVVTTPFVLVRGEHLAVPELKGWAVIVAIALVNGALGHFLMNWAHAHVPLMIISLMTLAIPVIAAAAAALLIDEPLTTQQVLGMGIVVSALSVVVLRSSRAVPSVIEAGGSGPIEPAQPKVG
jgi:inner membrane transporter RhtA